ncbi:MAG: hypothetical protein HKO90_11400, partial [Flavobacteriaceae bacterium]|nr:hypothetical protein [Flavobacteriaceae bacterium]
MKKLILAFVACLFYFSLSAQQSVAVYWDASYSMKDRDIDRELKFLGNYFKKHQEAVVTLKVFSNDIIQQEVVEVTGGDWSSLERELRSTIYDGASSYGFLFDDQVDEFLLFTDGYAKLGKLDPPTAKPINIVSSLKDTDTNALKLIADKSGGRFFYLPKEFEPEVKEKKELFTSNQSDGFIEGEVKGADGILANVSVVNQSNNQGVASGVDGSYRIEADEGDILIFSYLGKKTVSVRVAGADIINITMADINQSLDEV